MQRADDKLEKCLEDRKRGKRSPSTSLDESNRPRKKRDVIFTLKDAKNWRKQVDKS
jgi:hypothetical protein